MGNKTEEDYSLLRSMKLLKGHYNSFFSTVIYISKQFSINISKHYQGTLVLIIQMYEF